MKSLAEYFNLSGYQDAMHDGRWKYSLLFSASRKIAERTEREFAHSWGIAWILHTEGFHEMRLDMETLKFYKKDIEKMLKIVEEAL